MNGSRGCWKYVLTYDCTYTYVESMYNAQVLCPGDLIRGHVILKTPLALGVQITSLIVSHKVREMSDLDVRGLVQHENLATDKSKCEGVLEEMELDDVIQGEEGTV